MIEHCETCVIIRSSHHEILIILASLTKALFALEKLWRLGTPLLPSMLTIILSQFQTSIVFFSNNSQLFHTFIRCFCSFHCFYFTFFCIYMLSFQILFLSVEGCGLTSRKLILIFKTFLASERFYLLNISYPGYALIFNCYIIPFGILYTFDSGNRQCKHKKERNFETFYITLIFLLIF